jgi:hypothetical protein
VAAALVAAWEVEAAVGSERRNPRLERMKGRMGMSGLEPLGVGSGGRGEVRPHKVNRLFLH